MINRKIDRKFWNNSPCFDEYPIAGEIPSHVRWSTNGKARYRLRRLLPCPYLTVVVREPAAASVSNHSTPLQTTHNVFHNHKLYLGRGRVPGPWSRDNPKSSGSWRLDCSGRNTKRLSREGWNKVKAFTQGFQAKIAVPDVWGCSS